METSSLLRRIFIGAMFVLVGLLLLGFNLNILPEALRPYLFNWRALLVLAGLMFITKRHHFLIGLVFLIAALVLYLPLLVGCVVDFHAIFWPVVLIVSGLYLILRKKKERVHGQVPFSRLPHERQQV